MVHLEPADSKTAIWSLQVDRRRRDVQLHLGRQRIESRCHPRRARPEQPEYRLRVRRSIRELGDRRTVVRPFPDQGEVDCQRPGSTGVCGDEAAERQDATCTWARVWRGLQQRGFYRTDDATAAAPVFTDMTTAQNINYCTGQCWYDNVVYTPAGLPDVVYLMGSFEYGQIGGTIEWPRLFCCRPTREPPGAT